ncbi:MAG TPA: hypothetical protein PKD49_02975 [Hyphomicrobium sp.]|nr:hypothetical protein [Hyphomicrobium sp.]
MRKLQTTMSVAVMALAVAGVSATGALAFNKKVRKACGLDYQDFCSQYDPESSAVRRCFESNRRSLSKGCIRALVDAGEVPRKYQRR